MSSWDALEQSCHACRQCSLWETRTNVVFGSGWRQSPLLFVGEGPGAQEDATGLPFVGRAGKLLDDMLTVIGLNRSQVYIANIVKCRPPQNRDPLAVEQEACIGWLRKQVSLIRPKVLVCLGRVAAQRIIKDTFKITQEHGILFPKGSYQLMGTYHPSFLLRDPRRRPEAFEDLKKLEELLLRETPEIFDYKEEEDAHANGG